MIAHHRASKAEREMAITFVLCRARQYLVLKCHSLIDRVSHNESYQIEEYGLSRSIIIYLRPIILMLERLDCIIQ